MSKNEILDKLDHARHAMNVAEQAYRNQIFRTVGLGIDHRKWEAVADALADLPRDATVQEVDAAAFRAMATQAHMEYVASIIDDEKHKRAYSKAVDEYNAIVREARAQDGK